MQTKSLNLHNFQSKGEIFKRLVREKIFNFPLKNWA